MLLCFLKESKKPSSVIIDLILSLLKTQKDNFKYIYDIKEHLLLKTIGGWKYSSSSSGEVEIRRNSSATKSVGIFDEIDGRIEIFTQIVMKLSDNSISKLFSSILRSWLADRQKEDSDPFRALIDVRLLEKLSTDTKSMLMKSPEEILVVILSVLEHKDSSIQSQKKSPVETLSHIVKEEDSDDEDDDDETENVEVTKLCLSLTSSLIEDNQHISRELSKLVIAMIPVVQEIVDKNNGALKLVAKRCLRTLRSSSNISDNDKYDDDGSTRVLETALENLADPLVPIRAHGLHMLRELVQREDPVVDVLAMTKIFLEHLKDEDSFIYLNTIKGLETLADLHRNTVVPVLLAQYTSSAQPIDSKLRIGEALQRIVQRMGKALVNPLAHLITTKMISVISRRSTDKGLQDDRLRMSAMSILGTECENSQGLGDDLSDSVDCAVQILTFETAEDKNIMRRAAVVLLASLFRELDNVTLPRDLLNTARTRLEYTKETDLDNLVRAQAGQALEILINYT